MPLVALSKGLIKSFARVLKRPDPIASSLLSITRDFQLTFKGWLQCTLNLKILPTRSFNKLARLIKAEFQVKKHDQT